MFFLVPGTYFYSVLLHPSPPEVPSVLRNSAAENSFAFLDPVTLSLSALSLLVNRPVTL